MPSFLLAHLIIQIGIFATFVSSEALFFWRVPTKTIAFPIECMMRKHKDLVSRNSPLFRRRPVPRKRLRDHLSISRREKSDGRTEPHSRTLPATLTPALPMRPCVARCAGTALPPPRPKDPRKRRALVEALCGGNVTCGTDAMTQDVSLRTARKPKTMIAEEDGLRIKSPAAIRQARLSHAA